METARHSHGNGDKELKIKSSVKMQSSERGEAKEIRKKEIIML